MRVATSQSKPGGAGDGPHADLELRIARGVTRLQSESRLYD